MDRKSELLRVFERDRGRLQALALRILRNPADAEDALQDGFASALRGIERFRGDAQVSTWLHQIVRNAALMRLRSRRRRPECPLDSAREDQLAEDRRGVEQELGRRQIQDEVLRAARQLDPASLELLAARYFREEPLGDIAKRHRISRSAAKTRVHRARVALRQLLESLPLADEIGPLPAGGR